MEPNTVVQVAQGAASAQFDVWALFMRADIIVKTVMVGLAIASFWSWTIIFDKLGLLGRMRRRADQFAEKFWSGASLDGLFTQVSRRPDNPMSAIFVAAMTEWRKTFEGGNVSIAQSENVRQRIDKVMNVTLNREVATLERRLGFLATTGATAPFVGLFGTVWGIMNSFRAIAVSHDTNLAVVAPGIAEALFATALGLVAAVPAVIFFNRFSNEINRFAIKLEGFADDFSVILSRQFDERVH